MYALFRFGYLPLARLRGFIAITNLDSFQLGVEGFHHESRAQNIYKHADSRSRS